MRRPQANRRAGGRCIHPSRVSSRRASPHRTSPRRTSGADASPARSQPHAMRAAETDPVRASMQQASRDVPAWPPNAPAKLRANPTKCERSELPQIARQLQRTLCRRRADARLPQLGTSATRNASITSDDSFRCSRTVRAPAAFSRTACWPVAIPTKGSWSARAVLTSQSPSPTLMTR